MKKLLGALMFLVIGVMFIPVVMNSIDTYDVGSGTIITEPDTEGGEVNYAFEIIDIDFSTVEVYLDGAILVSEVDYTFIDLGNDLNYEMDVYDSTIGDIYTINYTYDLDVPAGVDGLINVVGILFVIGIVVGGVAYIKFSN